MCRSGLCRRSTQPSGRRGVPFGRPDANSQAYLSGAGSCLTETSQARTRNLHTSYTEKTTGGPDREEDSILTRSASTRASKSAPAGPESSAPKSTRGSTVEVHPAELMREYRRRNSSPVKGFAAAQELETESLPEPARRKHPLTGDSFATGVSISQINSRALSALPEQLQEEFACMEEVGWGQPCDGVYVHCRPECGICSPRNICEPLSSTLAGPATGQEAPRTEFAPEFRGHQPPGQRPTGQHVSQREQWFLTGFSDREPEQTDSSDGPGHFHGETPPAQGRDKAQEGVPDGVRAAERADHQEGRGAERREQDGAPIEFSRWQSNRKDYPQGDTEDAPARVEAEDESEAEDEILLNVRRQQADRSRGRGDVFGSARLPELERADRILQREEGDDGGMPTDKEEQNDSSEEGKFAILLGYQFGGGDQEGDSDEEEERTATSRLAHDGSGLERPNVREEQGDPRGEKKLAILLGYKFDGGNQEDISDQRKEDSDTTGTMLSEGHGPEDSDESEQGKPADGAKDLDDNGEAVLVGQHHHRKKKKKHKAACPEDYGCAAPLQLSWTQHPAVLMSSFGKAPGVPCFSSSSSPAFYLPWASAASAYPFNQALGTTFQGAGFAGVPSVSSPMPAPVPYPFPVPLPFPTAMSPQGPTVAPLSVSRQLPLSPLSPSTDSVSLNSSPGQGYVGGSTGTVVSPQSAIVSPVTGQPMGVRLSGEALLQQEQSLRQNYSPGNALGSQSAEQRYGHPRQGMGPVDLIQREPLQTPAVVQASVQQQQQVTGVEQSFLPPGISLTPQNAPQLYGQPQQPSGVQQAALSLTAARMGRQQEPQGAGAGSQQHTRAQPQAAATLQSYGQAMQLDPRIQTHQEQLQQILSLLQSFSPDAAGQLGVPSPVVPAVSSLVAGNTVYPGVSSSPSGNPNYGATTTAPGSPSSVAAAPGTAAAVFEEMATRASSEAGRSPLPPPAPPFPVLPGSLPYPGIVPSVQANRPYTADPVLASRAAQVGRDGVPSYAATPSEGYVTLGAAQLGAPNLYGLPGLGAGAGPGTVPATAAIMSSLGSTLLPASVPPRRYQARTDLTLPSDPSQSLSSGPMPRDGGEKTLLRGGTRAGQADAPESDRFAQQQPEPPQGTDDGEQQQVSNQSRVYRTEEKQERNQEDQAALQRDAYHLQSLQTQALLQEQLAGDLHQQVLSSLQQQQQVLEKLLAQKGIAFSTANLNQRLAQDGQSQSERQQQLLQLTLGPRLPPRSQEQQAQLQYQPLYDPQQEYTLPQKSQQTEQRVALQTQPQSDQQHHQHLERQQQPQLQPHPSPNFQELTQQARNNLQQQQERQQVPQLGTPQQTRFQVQVGPVGEQEDFQLAQRLQFALEQQLTQQPWTHQVLPSQQQALSPHALQDQMAQQLQQRPTLDNVGSRQEPDSFSAADGRAESSFSSSNQMFFPADTSGWSSAAYPLFQGQPTAPSSSLGPGGGSAADGREDSGIPSTAASDKGQKSCRASPSCCCDEKSAFCLPPIHNTESPSCEARKEINSPCSGIVANECADGYFCVNGYCQLPFGPYIPIAGQQQIPRRLQTHQSPPFLSSSEELGSGGPDSSSSEKRDRTAPLLQLGLGVDTAFVCPPGYRFEQQVTYGSSDMPEVPGMTWGRCQSVADMPCESDGDCGWGLFSLSVCHLTERRCVSFSLRPECLVTLQRLVHVLLIMRASSLYHTTDATHRLRVSSSAESVHCEPPPGELPESTQALGGRGGKDLESLGEGRGDSRGTLSVLADTLNPAVLFLWEPESRTQACKAPESASTDLHNTASVSSPPIKNSTERATLMHLQELRRKALCCFLKAENADDRPIHPGKFPRGVASLFAWTKEGPLTEAPGGTTRTTESAGSSPLTGTTWARLFPTGQVECGSSGASVPSKDTLSFEMRPRQSEGVSRYTDTESEAQTRGGEYGASKIPLGQGREYLLSPRERGQRAVEERAERPSATSIEVSPPSMTTSRKWDQRGAWSDSPGLSSKKEELPGTDSWSRQQQEGHPGAIQVSSAQQDYHADTGLQKKEGLLHESSQQLGPHSHIPGHQQLQTPEFEYEADARQAEQAGKMTGMELPHAEYYKMLFSLAQLQNQVLRDQQMHQFLHHQVSMQQAQQADFLLNQQLIQQQLLLEQILQGQLRNHHEQLQAIKQLQETDRIRQEQQQNQEASTQHRDVRLPGTPPLMLPLQELHLLHEMVLQRAADIAASEKTESQFKNNVDEQFSSDAYKPPVAVPLSDATERPADRQTDTAVLEGRFSLSDGTQATTQHQDDNAARSQNSPHVSMPHPSHESSPQISSDPRPSLPPFRSARSPAEQQEESAAPQTAEQSQALQEDRSSHRNQTGKGAEAPPSRAPSESQTNRSFIEAAAKQSNTTRGRDLRVPQRVFDGEAIVTLERGGGSETSEATRIKTRDIPSYQAAILRGATALLAVPPLLGHVVGDDPRRENGRGSQESQDWAWTVLSGTGDDRYVYVHLKLQCVNLICQRVRSESTDQGKHPTPLKNINVDQGGSVAADEENKAEQIWVGFLQEKLKQLKEILIRPVEERVIESLFPEGLDPSLAEILRNRRVLVHLFVSQGFSNASAPFSSPLPASAQLPAPAEFPPADSSKTIRRYSFFVAPRLNAHEVNFAGVLLDRFFLLNQENELLQSTPGPSDEEREADSAQTEDMVLEYLADLFTHAEGQARASVLFLLVSRILAGADRLQSEEQQATPRSLWRTAVRTTLEGLLLPRSTSIPRQLSPQTKDFPAEAFHESTPQPDRSGSLLFEDLEFRPSLSGGRRPEEQREARSPRRLSMTESGEHWLSTQKKERGRRTFEAFQSVWREVLRRELRNLYGPEVDVHLASHQDMNIVIHVSTEQPKYVEVKRDSLLPRSPLFQQSSFFQGLRPYEILVCPAISIQIFLLRRCLLIKIFSSLSTFASSPPQPPLQRLP
ncbi:glutamic acid-rich protein [Cystoisospora suis]|uniref:Glutamic acid-rich protein n=1 Tax=Cystoisospora suis TaxID=483139 RepID=A0A2C6KX82_9APIC|nr:glutamic acid-rich protein [Cystoisospora suis]